VTPGLYCSVVTTDVDDFYDNRFVYTIGVDFKIRTFERNGKIIKLQIWDTAGQERFRAITTSYYRGADGIIMVYDVNQPRTLNSISREWIKAVQAYAKRDPELLVVGNKMDLMETHSLSAEDTAEMEERIDELKQSGVRDIVKTSAKTGEQVEKAFEVLVDSMLENYLRKDRGQWKQVRQDRDQKTPSGGIHLLSPEPFGRSTSLCCGLF